MQKGIHILFETICEKILAIIVLLDIDWRIIFYAIIFDRLTPIGVRVCCSPKSSLRLSCIFRNYMQLTYHLYVLNAKKLKSS